MGRRKQPYRLWKRGKVYYYRLSWESGWKTTECTSIMAAREYVERQVLASGGPDCYYLKDYASIYFGEHCPWFRMENARRDKPLSVATRENHHINLVNHILPAWGYIPIEEMWPSGSILRIY